MQRSRQRVRTPVNLTEPLLERLNSYAIAAPSEIARGSLSVCALAGLASLGLVASIPAEAKIIYRPLNVWLGTYALNPAGQSVAPFVLCGCFSWSSTWAYWGRLSFNPVVAQAEFVRGPRSSWSVADLPRGAVVGPKAHWGGTRGLLASYGPGDGTYKKHRGGFQFGVPGYVGFKFAFERKEHYGWARMTVRLGKNSRGQKYTYAHLTGYAWQTIPGRPIHAGQKHSSTWRSEDHAARPASIPSRATLGMLALGAPGLSVRRGASKGY